MWNLISCNKLTEERFRQRSYDKHVKKVNAMKPKLKIAEPDQPWFIYAKKKKQLARNEQLMDIEKNNHLLLAKIKNIERRQNDKFKKSTFLTTLNSKIMRDVNEQIFKENQRICSKIMQTETFYKTSNILENSNNLERVMRNISVNARRVQSAKSLALSKSKISRPLSSSIRRPQSSIPSSQYTTKFQTIQKPSISEHRVTRPSTAPSNKKFRAKSEEKYQVQEQGLEEFYQNRRQN